VPAGLNAAKNYGYYEQADARLGPPYYFGHDSIPPSSVINQGEDIGLGELGSAAVELASTFVALIT